MEIEKQICINRFNVPRDISIIIKDFLWFDIQIAKVRKIKNKACNQINRAFCSSISTRILPQWFTISNERRWIYRTTDIDLNCVFCNKCGNYIQYMLKNGTCKCII